MSKYLVIDTETTGLNPDKHTIITLSASLFDSNYNLVSSFDGYNDSWEEYECDLNALKVNGFRFGNRSNIGENIKNLALKEQLKNQFASYSCLQYMIKSFSNYLATNEKIDYVIGMNVKFDLSFIHATSKLTKVNLDNAIPHKVIDPLVVANALFDSGVLKDIKSINSKNLYEKFDIPYQGIHNSHVDVQLTFELWKKMKTMISSGG
jgi:DNA polymerase-3 subunit epsilon